MADDNSGFGIQNPNDVSHEMSVTSFICRQIMAELNVMKLVKVTAVTGGGVNPAGTVEVQPLVSQIDGNGNGTDHGVISGIPWSRVQGGKNAIICDPMVGDFGYVICEDRDTSKVRNTKAAALPGTRRRNDIADGVYAGGALNVAPDQYLIFTADSVRLVDNRGSSLGFTSSGVSLVDGVNGNSLVSTSSGMTMTFAGANKIIMAAGFVNIVAPVLQVNGTPMNVP